MAFFGVLWKLAKVLLRVGVTTFDNSSILPRTATQGSMIQLYTTLMQHTDHMYLVRDNKLKQKWQILRGLEIFRIYQPSWNGRSRFYVPIDIDQIVQVIKDWYQAGCQQRIKCDINVSYS